MSEFLGFYVSHDGKTIYPGDLRSHRVAEEVHGLSSRFRGKFPPWPGEWTEDDDGASLCIRVGGTARHDEDWYRERILRQFPRRESLIAHCLASLSPSVTSLDLRWTVIKSLPDLPVDLKYLDLRWTVIESLPELPNGLEYLYLAGSSIKRLPVLPKSLEYLDVRETAIKGLPELPAGLKYLCLDGTQIERLPNLPKGLERLYMAGTPIKRLPKLPKGTRVFGFGERD